MKLIPPPPPVDPGGTLAVRPSDIRVTMVAGIIGGCVICATSTMRYWRHDNRFHPLHESCAQRLVEHWETMLDSGEDGVELPAAAPEPTGLTGAYARRARRAAGAATQAAPVSRAIAAQIPLAVQRNPFWKPGMEAGAPWTVLTETTVGRSAALFGTGERRARAALDRAESGAGLERPGQEGVLVLGGVLVAPDGSIAGRWGNCADPFSDPLYRPLTRVGGGGQNWGWERCRGCNGWLWPGRWIVATTRHCGACAAPADGGRPWPVEPPAPSRLAEPPPPLKKKSAKRDSLALD